MKPTIVTKPAFSVVGMKVHTKNENNEIPTLWAQFNPRFPEIKEKISPALAYGICGEMEEDGQFNYMAGFEVSDTADIPEGMASWQVPEHKYAAFPCTLKTIGETYQYIHQSWLPESGHQRAAGPDFEFYPGDFETDDEEGSTLYIYIPIK